MPKEVSVIAMLSVSRIVATGGLAPLIADASQYIDTVDETLTLDGLRIVYERTRRRSAW